MEASELECLPAQGLAEPPAPFIVGTGRSGTTLLRMMLDAHSELAIPPETEFGLPLKAFERGGVSAAVDAVTRTPRWGDFNIPAEEFAAHALAESPETFGELMRVFYRFYAERREKPRWGDKSPYYVGAMKVIQRRLIPEARFVHTIRDGRDVALSMNPLWFGPDSPAEMARLWRETIEDARRQAEILPFYMEVRYESLVLDPVATLRQICDFLELEWQSGMLDYHQLSSQRLMEETADWQMQDRVVPREERIDIHRFLGSPPRRDRVERWRKEMNVAGRREFERIAGDTLEELGYPVGE